MAADFLIFCYISQFTLACLSALSTGVKMHRPPGFAWLHNDVLYINILIDINNLVKPSTIAANVHAFKQKPVLKRVGSLLSELHQNCSLVCFPEGNL